MTHKPFAIPSFDILYIEYQIIVPKMIQVVFELLDTQYNMVSNFLCKSKEERDVNFIGKSKSNLNHFKSKY